MNRKNKKLLFRLLLSSLFLFSSSMQAEGYFEKLAKINRLPANSLPILPCNINEKRQVIALLKQDNINDFGELTLIESEKNKKLIGKIYNESKEWVEIYKGDFSNAGTIEYMLVLDEWGSAHRNDVRVYKSVNNHLVKIPLPKMPYTSVASPFAITQEGKTYLRFIHLPIGETNYDNNQLQLCSYFWQGKKFNLVNCLS